MNPYIIAEVLKKYGLNPHKVRVTKGSWDSPIDIAIEGISLVDIKKYLEEAAKLESDRKEEVKISYLANAEKDLQELLGRKAIRETILNIIKEVKDGDIR